MKAHIYYVLLLIAAATLLTNVASAQIRRNATDEGISAAGTPRIPSDPASLLAFTENRGQIADMSGQPRPDILYTIQTRAASLYFLRDRVSYVFNRIEERVDDHADHDASHSGESHDDELPFKLTGMYRMDMELIGSNPRPVVEAAGPLESYSNYYLGHCPDGIRQVRSYNSLTYRNIYPKIDMVLRMVEGGVKCDFVVRPGGRVSDIRLRYVAADELKLGDDGSLMATTPLGYIEEEAPYTYQTLGTGNEEIASRYLLEGDVVRFVVGEYDESKPLVIDPYRKWATYYGGTGNETLLGGDPSEVDRTGNVLVGGYNTGGGFPTSTGAHQTGYGGAPYDAFVMKFNSAGNRVWATYYGGNGEDLTHGVVADIDRNVFIAGHTTSTNFPVGALTGNYVHQNTAGGNRDAFVVKFDSAGTRQWGTYYGGSNWDDGYGFAADSAGNVAAFITTGSSGLGTAGTFQSTKPSGTGNGETSYDILIAKMTGTGSRVWATYYGGSSTEYGYAGGSDNHQNILLTGWTYSSNFPVSSGAHQTSLGGSADAFVVKLAVDGTRRWATYYGGSSTDNDEGTTGYCGLATDGADNVFISGSTRGNFPVTTGAMQTTFGGTIDAFAVKFDSTGSRQWATYIGGGGTDIGAGIASNAVGGVLVTGRTNSTTGFPITATTYQAVNAGNYDVFITKLSSTGANVWSTYYGGTGADYGEGISFDPFGSVYVAGSTASTNFPVSNPAYQGTYGGNTDAFIILFCDIDPDVIDTSGVTSFCDGDSVVLSVERGYASVQWYSNNTGTTVISTADSITVRTTGRFWARLTNGAGCVAYTDSIQVNVYPNPDPVLPTGPLSICQGDSVVLDAGSGYATYRWNTGATSQRITVRQAGYYNVTVTTVNGCTDSAGGVTVNVNPRPDSVWIDPAGPLKFCDGDSRVLTAMGGHTNVTYLWSTGERQQSITITKAGIYTVTVTNQAGCTVKSNPVTVSLWPKPNPQIFPSGPTIFCEGDSIIMAVAPGYRKYEWSTGDTTFRITAKTSGTYSVTVTDTNGCIGTGMLSITVQAPPEPRISVIGQIPFCEGDSVRLDAGGNYRDYFWSTGERTRSITVKKAGRYSVHVVDGVGCQGNSDTVDVEVKPRPKATLIGPIAVCANATSQYSVPADTATGTTYTWVVTGGGTISSGQGTNAITVQWGANGTGTVRITVTSANGCSASAQVSVRVGSDLEPVITANPSFKLCPGDSTVLDAGPYTTYQWSTGETTRRITVKTPGNYTVTVTEGNCSGSSKAVMVTLNSPPTPVINAAKWAICPGETLELDAGGPYDNYVWSTGASVQKITISDTGEYFVTVTDTNGCSNTSAKVHVTFHPLPTPVIAGPNSVCLNSTATYSVAGATPGNGYNWSVNGAGGTITGGQGTSSITVNWSASGTGAVSVDETSTATGCTGTSEQYFVSVGTTLTPEITTVGSTTICEGDSVTLSAPAGYSSYNWSTGQTTQEITVKLAGNYHVTVTDAGGCSGSDSIDVVIHQLPFPFIQPGGPIGICPGDSVVLTAAPGYIEYLWTTGETTQQIVVRTPGDYSVTATNENGCRGASEVVNIFVNPAPPKPDITVDGNTLTSTPAATYQWYFEGELIPGATSQEYIAAKPGKYSVAITDGNGCSAVSDPKDAVEADAVIELAEYEAVPGERLKIPIKLTGGNNLDNVGIHKYEMTIRFYRSLLYPVSPVLLDSIDGAFRIITIEGDRGTVSSGDIGTFEVIAALGDTLETPLYIDDFKWTDGSGQVRTVNGLVRVKPQGGWRLYLPEGRLSLLEPRPNPTAGPTVIIYEVIEPGHTQLYLVNMLGQRMATLVDAEITVPDRYNLIFDPSGTAAGIYFLVLETPTGRLAQPMQIQH